MRVLFFGTPKAAVPFLDWLIQHTTVTGVVCRPDEPVGRGYTLTPPPTKVLAQAKGVPVFQPTGPWNESVIQEFRETKSDVGIVVAYGRLMPEPVFLAPRLGSINIHFSLLPRYRGAAPIQWSLINGETKTGVSAFWLEKGLDSGPLCGQAEVAVDPGDTTPTLRDKLISSGLHVLESVLNDLSAGRVIRDPQQGEVTLAPQLTKEMGRVNWTQPAISIVNLVRGVVEWPGAFTRYKLSDGTERQLKIFSAVAQAGGGAQEPGTILNADNTHGISVKAGEGVVLLRQVQPEGKKPMAAWAFWQGARLKKGDKFE